MLETSRIKLCIILTRPQLGENIGSVARVMSNFGLSDLRIVNPRKDWSKERALELSANGAFVFENATYYDSLENALFDVQILYGTASLRRFMNKEVTTSYQIPEFKILNKTVGILFGCEQSGLSNEELNLCDKIIEIPTSELNHSLNLAQAVAIIAYEFSKFQFKASSLTAIEAISKKDLKRFVDFLDELLEEKNFFKSPKMKPTMMQNITNIFARNQLTDQELRTLYGIVRALKS